MGRIIKLRRNKRRPATAGGVPVTTDEYDGLVGQAEHPDALAHGRTGQFDEVPGSAQTDMQRADERKVGSIEALPQAGPDDDIPGFLEPVR